MKDKYSRAGLRDLDFNFNHESSLQSVVDGRVVDIHPSAVRNFQLSLIEAEIRKCEAQHVLEIGAGTGINLYLLQQRLPDVRFSGIDLVEDRIETGKNYLREHFDYSPNSVVGDATDMRFAHKSFDLVYSVHCFEQMNRFVDAALSEAVRVCRHRLVFIEPDWKYSNLAQKLFLLNNDYLRDFDRSLRSLPGHFEHKKMDTYNNPLNRSGLFIVDLSAPDSRG